MPDAKAPVEIASHHEGKTYAYNEDHDENRPSQMWFQESDEGLILFIVFYTQACRYSRCLGCNLPSTASRSHVNYRALINQVDYVFSDPEVIERRMDIRKVIVSNNGSVLDQDTFSSTALIYLVAKLNLNMSHLYVLSLETRVEYIDVPELEFLARALAEGDVQTQMELAVGMEAFDDRIRNEVFYKGLELEAFEDTVAMIAPYGFKLKCYFMLKPVPGMSDDEGIQDIQRAIEYLCGVSRKHGVTISMHLNPTFVAYGTQLEKSFQKGEYTPPRLIDVARAAVYAENRNVPVFLGLFDEGLAVKGGSFLRAGEEKLVKTLERFNRTQDFEILKNLLCPQ
jgi:hypothetical protein